MYHAYIMFYQCISMMYQCISMMYHNISSMTQCKSMMYQYISCKYIKHVSWHLKYASICIMHDSCIYHARTLFFFFADSFSSNSSRTFLFRPDTGEIVVFNLATFLTPKTLDLIDQHHLVVRASVHLGP